ncbi:hypothetical protein GCM10009584_11560 [Ornithinimicrobium humiphilum]
MVVRERVAATAADVSITRESRMSGSLPQRWRRRPRETPTPGWAGAGRGVRAARRDSHDIPPHALKGAPGP